jgi:hypothetical protein
VNTKFAELADKSLAAVRRNSRRKAKAALKQLRDEIRERQEDLVTADTSPNGWPAVAKLRNRSELSDELRRKFEQVDKEIWRSRSYGGAQKKFRKFKVKTMAREAMSGPTEPRTTTEEIAPEELLFNAAKQIQAGKCSHCDKKNHFYWECPDFWIRYRSHGRRGREVSRTRSRMRHSVQGEGREGACATVSRTPIQPRPTQLEASAQPPHPQQPPQHQAGWNSWGVRGQQRANPGGNGR